MRKIVAGMLLGFLISACAGFQYRYYGLDMSDASCYDKGILLSTKPSDDLPFTRCKPDDYEKGKCVVMLADEFYSFKKDYIRLKIELEDCQKQK